VVGDVLLHFLSGTVSLVWLFEHLHCIIIVVVFVCVYTSLGVCRSRGVMRKLDSYEKIETKLRSTIENLHEPRVESLHTRRDT